MSEGVRCFVAVNLPAPLREEIGAFFAALRGSVRGVRWVAAANLHLTLKFLGDVEQGQVSRVANAVAGALEGSPPVEVTLAGAGVFPPRGRPRVVWLDLAAGAEGIALEPLGFPRERRPYTPHLTVGRVKKPGDPAPLLAAVDTAGKREWGGFTASSVDLVRSELFPTGARYSILREVRLKG
jgi:2'-5' RNA ligase